MFQVELEARHSGAQSHLGSNIEIVSKGKGGVEQRNCWVLPLDPLLLLFMGILFFSSGPAAT